MRRIAGLARFDTLPTTRSVSAFAPLLVVGLVLSAAPARALTLEVGPTRAYAAVAAVIAAASTVRGCDFHDDENGILSGDLDRDTNDLLIEDRQFADNGFCDAYSHNL